MSITHIACHECDLLLEYCSIQEGEQAKCPRCGCTLYANKKDALAKTLAYAYSAAIFLTLANLYPFLTFQAKGHEQVITLLQAVMELYEYGSIFLSAFILMFIIVVPAVLLFCIIATLTPVVISGNVVKGSKFLGRLFIDAKPWSMAQVFLIGVLVTVIKIASMATVVMGISFWAYVAFTVFITLSLTSLDSHKFWEIME